jgi:hypothetical protein
VHDHWQTSYMYIWRTFHYAVLILPFVNFNFTLFSFFFILCIIILTNCELTNNSSCFLFPPFSGEILRTHHSTMLHASHQRFTKETKDQGNHITSRTREYRTQGVFELTQGYWNLVIALCRNPLGLGNILDLGNIFPKFILVEVWESLRLYHTYSLVCV